MLTPARLEHLEKMLGWEPLPHGVQETLKEETVIGLAICLKPAGSVRVFQAYDLWSQVTWRLEEGK